jgi:hypothetical protein
MKRTALAIFLITVVALSIATWFVHSQISELQAQNSELRNQNRDLYFNLSEFNCGLLFSGGF